MGFVRKLRERRGLKQSEVAEQLGCNKATVSLIEHGKMLPSLERFARLARVLKVPPSRLLDELLTAYDQCSRRAPASVTNLQEERERRSPPPIDH